MITFSNFTLEGKTRVKTVSKEKYPDTPVITKLAIEEGQRSASIHFNTKAQEMLGVEIPTQVVIVNTNGTFLIAAFDKVKEVNPELAQAFEARKMVYRLGMNGKVSSKAIHAELKDSEYKLVVENEAESIFRLEVLQQEYTPVINVVNAELTTTPTNVIVEEPIFEPANNVEAYDEF
jgi:outer membrane lipopolysaccharide assembly protein LptE/RlpB